jgi:hypothetical protein
LVFQLNLSQGHNLLPKMKRKNNQTKLRIIKDKTAKTVKGVLKNISMKILRKSLRQLKRLKYLKEKSLLLPAVGKTLARLILISSTC